MGKGAFIIPYQVAAVSADSAQATNPATNMTDGIPGKVYKSEGSTAEIVIQLNSPENISGISIHNHNIPTAGSSVALSFSSDGSTWGTPVAAPVNPGNFYIVCDQTYEYIKVAVSIPSGDIEIGQVVVGHLLELPENFQYPYRIRIIKKKKVIDVNGQFYQRLISSQRGYELPFELVSPTQRTQYEELLEADYRVFLPDLDLLECYHGVVTQETLDVERSVGDAEKFTCTFLENAICK